MVITDPKLLLVPATNIKNLYLKHVCKLCLLVDKINSFLNFAIQDFDFGSY